MSLSLAAIAASGSANLVQTVLIIDTETTGLDPATDQVVEVGAILYDLEYATTIEQLSFLLPLHPTVQRTPGQTVLPANGLSIDLLSSGPLPDRNKEHGKHKNQLDLAAIAQINCVNLSRMAMFADCVLAHNASFDRQWFGSKPLDKTATRPLVLPELVNPQGVPLPWVCSQHDLVWFDPNGTSLQPLKPMSLLHLANTYRVPVWQSHRALDDCQLLAHVLTAVAQSNASPHAMSLPQRFQKAFSPSVVLVAQVNYNTRELAKAYGFRWEPDVKEWQRTIRQGWLDYFEFPFACVVKPFEPEATYV